MGGGSSGYRAALVRRRLTPALISFDDEDELAEPPTTEPMFQRIQATLQEIHADHSVPKEVRRRVLEGSVRAPPGLASRCDSRGLLQQRRRMEANGGLLHGMDSRFRRANTRDAGKPKSRPSLRGGEGGGNWGVDAAWPHVAALLTSEATEKSLLLAAIEAAVWIRPREAKMILIDLADSDDEEIAEAVSDASMEQGPDELDDKEEED